MSSSIHNAVGYTVNPYGRRWRKLRLLVLRAEPLCRMCAEIGRTSPATVVDHIKPIRDGGTNAWDNLQPLCKRCHDGAKQSFEATGKMRGCDADGLPLDPGHHWNQ